MTRRRLSAAALAAGLVGAVVLWAARPGGAQVVGPAGKPVRIATVDLNQVTQTCRQALDYQAELERQREEKLKAVNELQQKLKKANDDLGLLKKDSPAWRDQSRRIMQLEVEARVLGDLSIKELQAQNLDYTTRIYDTINAQTAEYAKAHGIDVVLRTGEIDLESKTIEELYRKTSLRMVLYAAPAVDITEDIRRAVDQAYEKAGRTP